MRIVIHTIFYRPELTGVGKYTAELCEWLAARGHDVRVVAPPPYYPQWRVRPPHQQWRYSRERLGGVAITRCPLWLPRSPGGIARVLYEGSFALTSAPAILREMFRKPDLIVVIQPSLLNTVASLAAARCCGAKAWLHIQDFEIDLAYGLGQLKRGRKLFSAVEAWLMRRFDAVSSISRAMLSKARLKGVPDSRLHLLPNWIDPAEIYPLPGISPLRRELGIGGDVVVALYSGSLSAKQGLETIIDASRALSDQQDLVIIVSGEGPAEESLRRRAGKLANLRFLPLQPANRLNDLLNLADVHLLPQLSSASDSVMPSKLLGMLASGRPVIAAARTGTEISTLAGNCGIVIEPSNPEAMAKAVLRLKRDARLRAAFGAAAREKCLELFQREPILLGFERQILSEAQDAFAHGVGVT